MRAAKPRILDSRQPCSGGLQILLVPLGGGDNLIANAPHFFACPMSSLFRGFRLGLDPTGLIAQVLNRLFRDLKLSGVFGPQHRPLGSVSMPVEAGEFYSE